MALHYSGAAEADLSPMITSESLISPFTFAHTEPAMPGNVQDIDPSTTSRLALDSDVLDVFNTLRNDGGISNEEAFLKLITTYNVSVSALNEVFSKVYSTCLFVYISLILSTHSQKSPGRFQQG
jgi:hypothetical protein